MRIRNRLTVKEHNGTLEFINKSIKLPNHAHLPYEKFIRGCIQKFQDCVDKVINTR
jgi:hypothetical protein